LPPVHQSREFDPLDSTGDAKFDEEAVEVRFDRPPIHPEFVRNFQVRAAL